MKTSIIKSLIATSLILSASVWSSTINNTHLTETNHLVTAGNKSVTLLGTQINQGDMAPDFKVVDANFSTVKLSDFLGKNILISVVPSLDTGVCSLQTQRFNQEVASLEGDVVILTISNDLPYAQARFCKNEKITNMKVLSDSVWRDFGAKYGLLIKDMGLLTRAIFIIDPQSKVTYKELVSNISHLPNMEQALNALKKQITPTTKQ